MLKGMGANLSAEGLRQAAMELERTCRDGLHEDAASALARLRDEVHRCLAHVPDALAELPIR
jgi:HPt (histidine-containing phosphotransfer) domain-containing protein